MVILTTFIVIHHCTVGTHGVHNLIQELSMNKKNIFSEISNTLNPNCVRMENEPVCTF